MNTKDQAWEQIVDFLNSDKEVLLLQGTHSQEKHKLAIHVIRSAHPPAKLLFRTNNQQHLATVSGYSYADTFNLNSQKRTPRDFDIAVAWPIDPLGPQKGGELIYDLRLRGAKKIVLATWIDDKDYNWVDNYDPARVWYDIEAESPIQHEATKNIESRQVEQSLGNLPAYARDVDPKYLVRLHCGRCNAGRWAQMNKPFPGTHILQNDHDGEYTAKCLKCGTEANDAYNWFGQ